MRFTSGDDGAPRARGENRAHVIDLKGDLTWRKTGARLPIHDAQYVGS